MNYQLTPDFKMSLIFYSLSITYKGALKKTP